MSAEVASLVAQASNTSTGLDAPILSSASESDAARMQDLMSTQAVQAAAPPAPPAIPGQGNTLGDSMLRSMDSVGKAYKERAAEADRMIGDPSIKLNATDLLRVQLRLAEASLHVDLISKCVSKSVQHVDQMIKLQ